MNAPRVRALVPRLDDARTPRTPTCARLILAYSPFRDTGESSDGDAETSSECLGDRRARVPSNPDNPLPDQTRQKGASRRVQRLQLPLHALRRRLRGGRHRTHHVPGRATLRGCRGSRHPPSHRRVPGRSRRRAPSPHRAFRSLARAIVFQQLNGAAAATIFARVVAVAAPDADPARLSPAGILSADEAAMRACGLSQRKLEYLRGLALAFTPANQVEGGGGLDDETLERASAEDVTRSLVALRGLGPWTVHMFRMFYLNHADVLPVGDFGVRRGMMLLYGLSSMPGPEKMQAIAEPWAPYRTIGAMYMWRKKTTQRKIRKSPRETGKGRGTGEGKRETPRVRRERTRSS